MSYVTTGIESETITTDPKTGGQKGKKLAQLGALDPVTLYHVAEVAGYGADKYAPFNYLKGYDFSLSYNALQRHLQKFWMGETVDPESELQHLGHAAWHCLTLLSFMLRGVGTDDRPPSFEAMLEQARSASGVIEDRPGPTWRDRPWRVGDVVGDDDDFVIGADQYASLPIGTVVRNELEGGVEMVKRYEGWYFTTDHRNLGHTAIHSPRFITYLP